MTLVLTKVTRDGIAMAADAALTETYLSYGRVLIGASKLLAHAPSSSCLGIWGDAVLPNPTPGAHPIALEFVLRQFLDIARSIENAEDLSGKLVEWLNDNFPVARGVIGIDVASVRAAGRQATTVIHRLMNAVAVDAEPARFRRFTIRAAGAFDEVNDTPILSAGDLNAEFWVDEIRAAIRNAAIRTGQSLPDNAEQTAAWLAVLVRTISDLYRNLQISQTIDGPVRTSVLHLDSGIVTVR